MYWIELQYVSKAHVYYLKSLNNRNNLYTMPEATFKELAISFSVLTQVTQAQRVSVIIDIVRVKP